MILLRGSTFAVCVSEAAKRGLSYPDYCVKTEGRWTFGYLIKKGVH